jgi:hypothetical protein
MNKSESPLPKDDLCQLWLQLAQRFCRRSRKCKSLTDRRQTDKRRSEYRAKKRENKRKGKDELIFFYVYTILPPPHPRPMNIKTFFFSIETYMFHCSYICQHCLNLNLYFFILQPTDFQFCKCSVLKSLPNSLFISGFSHFQVISN